MSHYLTHISGLFCHRQRLFFADHKDSAIDLSMMIHIRALLRVPLFSLAVTNKRKNRVHRYPHEHYLVTHILSTAEKPLFTELIMFLNAVYRIRTYKSDIRPRISNPLQYHYGNTAKRHIQDSNSDTDSSPATIGCELSII